MKDPLDCEERPYEVLGVSPDIRAIETEKIYGAFLKDRRNIARRQAARVAYDRIRRIERRVEDEMFYYPCTAAALDALLGGEIPPFTHDAVPPPVDFDIVALATQCQACSEDFDPFSTRKVQLALISIFEERLLKCLPIEFPS